MNKAEFEIYQSMIIPLKLEPIECIELMNNLVSELCILEIGLPIDDQIIKLKIEQQSKLDKGKNYYGNIIKSIIERR